MPKISQRHIRSWRVLVPPLKEQRAVVAVAKVAVSKIDATSRRAQTEILLVREYRSRLIADVVTGKLDVREAAARLPDEAVETDAIDEVDETDPDAVGETSGQIPEADEA
jgi:type I restriction enzyme S subunit